MDLKGVEQSSAKRTAQGMLAGLGIVGPKAAGVSSRLRVWLRRDRSCASYLLLAVPEALRAWCGHAPRTLRTLDFHFLGPP